MEQRRLTSMKALISNDVVDAFTTIMYWERLLKLCTVFGVGRARSQRSSVYLRVKQGNVFGLQETILLAAVVFLKSVRDIR